MKPIIDAFTDSEQRLHGRESFRVFHGRGGCYPDCNWCNIDFFAPAVLITLYREPPAGWEAQLRQFIAKLMARLPIEKVMLQRRYLPRAPTEVSIETARSPEKIYARRGELDFSLSFAQQNCGFFLDIEPARRWLEQHCLSKKILNMFAYTCTFSVVAMRAGADAVVNIDLSDRSLKTGQKNHRINAVDADRVRFLPHDIFKSWGKLKRLGPYDIVVIDPPSYQKGSFVAKRDYPKVLRRMDQFLTEDGVFLACLNAPEVNVSEFEEIINLAVNGCTLSERLSASPDFPDAEESALKMLVYKRINRGALMK